MTELKPCETEKTKGEQLNKIENRMLMFMVRQNGRTALLKKWNEEWVKQVRAWNKREGEKE